MRRGQGGGGGGGGGASFKETPVVVKCVWRLFRTNFKNQRANFGTHPPEALSWIQDLVTPNLPNSVHTRWAQVYTYFGQKQST